MKSYWVYIMASGKNGTTYIGVTNDLKRRAWEHREGKIAGFTQRYGIKLLVYYEGYQDINQAIERETRLKGCSRQKKVALIEDVNPFWEDRFSTL